MSSHWERQCQMIASVGEEVEAGRRSFAEVVSKPNCLLVAAEVGEVVAGFSQCYAAAGLL